MDVRSVFLFWLGWLKRACRLPPANPAFGASVPDGSGKLDGVKTGASLDEPGLVVLLIVITLLIMPLVAPLTWLLPTSASITAADEISDNTGATIASIPAESSSEILILNSTPFDLDSGWDWSGKSDGCICTPTDQGLRLDIASDFLPWAGTESLYFYSQQQLVLQDYDLTVWYIVLELISGALDVKMSFDLSDWRSYGSLYKSQYWHINETGVVVLSLKVPIALLRTVSTDWLVDCEASAELSTDSAASAIIMNSTIEVTSDTVLTPFTIDVADSLNVSLFQNPSFKYMYDPAAVRLSKQGNPHNGTFFIRRANTTIHLSPGNYDGEIGWAGSYPEVISEPIPFDVEIVAGEMRLVRAHLGVILLYLDLPPSVFVSELWIGRSSWYDGLLYHLDSWTLYQLDWQLPSRLYLPIVDGNVAVHLSFRVPALIFGGLTYSSAGATSLLPDAHHNLRFVISSPVLSVLGVSVGLGEALMLIPGLVTAYAFTKNVQWRMRQRGARDIMQDPRFLPTGLLILGAFLPWFHFSNIVGWTLENYYVCVPLPVSLCGNPDSNLILTVNQLWYVLLLLSLPLYWRPLYRLAHHLSTGTEDQVKTKFRQIIAPVVLVVIVVTVPLLFLGATLSVGSEVILAAPLVWGLQRVVKRKEDRVTEKLQEV